MSLYYVLSPHRWRSRKTGMYHTMGKTIRIEIGP